MNPDKLGNFITDAFLEALERKSEIDQTPEMKAACKKAIEILKRTIKGEQK